MFFQPQCHTKMNCFYSVYGSNRPNLKYSLFHILFATLIITTLWKRIIDTLCTINIVKLVKKNTIHPI